jgi:alpha-ketoglutarate-dependent taurine dioxygenase
MKLAEIKPDRVDEETFAEIARTYRQHGIGLVRGCVFDLQTFEMLSKYLCDFFHHVGTRQRSREEGGDGYTTEVFRQNFMLLGHSEGTYRPYPPPPDVCLFMCVTAPEAAGGETTVIDGIAMLEMIPEALRNRLIKQGIVYESWWEADRWQAEFGVHSEHELRELLGRLAHIRFSLDQGNLHLLYRASAIVDCSNGELAFANGVLAHLPHIEHPRYENLPVYTNESNRVYFGDGEELDAASINALIDAHDNVIYRHQWQRNDVLILDNTRYMHGREMCSKPCDRVLISRFGTLRREFGASESQGPNV